MPVTRLEKLLKSGTSGRLRELVQTAQEMQSLTGALRRSLPGELAAAIASAAVADGELTVRCRSQAFAARLRFESDVLLAAAARHGARADRCRVRVGQDAQESPDGAGGDRSTQA